MSGTATSIFFLCFAIVVISTLILTILQATFCLRLRKEAPSLYANLGSPGPLYFLAGTWLGAGRYVRSLLVFDLARSNLLARSTQQFSIAVSIFFYFLMIGWLAGLGTLLLPKD